jgi:pimeloyl-ACP methyl ester carboxylesterase
MTRTIYALLVGINEYLGAVPQLFGCVNDVKRMDQFLRHRVDTEKEFVYDPVILTSEDHDKSKKIKPTRETIIKEFRQHLGKAGENDVALFYYSGHGSQEKAPPEFWKLEPDHLDETIVCYDSRTEGKWDLADKELAILISDIAKIKAGQKKPPHIVVILDSCHSGSATRAADADGIRLAPGDDRERPLNQFIGYKEIQKWEKTNEAKPGNDWIELPQGRHLVISACRAEETAAERLIGTDGEIRGVMSYYLLDTLQRTSSGLTYRDIVARTQTLVHNQISQQNPVVDATEVQMLQEPFLGGAIKSEPPYFNVNYVDNKGWTINGGAVHGIKPRKENETTTLAVFKAGTDLGAIHTLDQALGEAYVTEDVEAGESCVELKLKSGQIPDTKDTFKAMVVGQPLPQITVALLGDKDGLKLIRKALKTCEPGKKPSLIVRELSKADISVEAKKQKKTVQPRSTAPLTLTAAEGHYTIARSGDAYPLVVRIEEPDGYSDASARLAVQRLEHIARWLQTAELDNPTSKLPVHAVEMEFYAVNQDGSQGEKLDLSKDIVLSYKAPYAKKDNPRFMLRLVNTTDQKLYVALLSLSESFGVSSAGLQLGSNNNWIMPNGQPGDTMWALYKGTPVIPSGIPTRIRESKVTNLRDIIKLIISTSQIEETLLEIDELDVVLDRGAKNLGVSASKSSLHRLMKRIHTRSIGADFDQDENVSDWVTSQVVLTTIWPLDSATIEPKKPTEIVKDIVSLDSHAGLRARISVKTLSQAGRDAGNLTQPPLFRQHPEIAQPFPLITTRGGDPDLCVFELLVEDESYKTVTHENPLVFHVARPVERNEFVLPIAFDWENQIFLPVGISKLDQDNRTTVEINQLPKPGGTKDAIGSIKLCLWKLAAEKLHLDKIGIEKPVLSQLRIASVGSSGEIIYDDSPIALAEKTAKAKRILLYIHGFTGDTRDMVRSSQGLPNIPSSPPPALAKHYDLILAFDYESINTKIELTAEALKSALEKLQLDKEHGKTIHIIAHSMGCLVTRWFIEKLNGAKYIDKVVFAGPPNGGVPWAKLEDWAIWGFGIALNGLAALAWPPSVIPTLIGYLATAVAGVEGIDNAMDEIGSGSDFFKQIDNSDYPGAIYTVIAGNTSKIPSIKANEKGLKALVSCLKSKQTRNKVLSLFFGNKPNDMAISIESMLKFPEKTEWVKPKHKEVACDHCSYFVDEKGVAAIAEALIK